MDVFDSLIFLGIRIARQRDSSYLLSLKTSWFLDETLGVIAQLVERLHGMEEVWGSTPHGSTKCSLDLLKDPTPGSKLEYNSGQGSGEVEIAVKTALHIVDVHVSVSSFEIDVAG